MLFKCCYPAIQTLHSEGDEERQEPEIRATTHLRPNYTGFHFSGSCVNKSIPFCRALGFWSGFSRALSSEMSAYKYSKVGNELCAWDCECFCLHILKAWLQILSNFMFFSVKYCIFLWALFDPADFNELITLSDPGWLKPSDSDRNSGLTSPGSCADPIHLCPLWKQEH